MRPRFILAAALGLLPLSAVHAQQAAPTLAVSDTASLAIPGVPAGKTPEFINILAVTPKAQAPMARLYTTVLYGGTLPSAMKMAMGLKVAEETGSPYVKAHLRRLLETSDEGRALVKKASGRDALAVGFASALTRDIANANGPAWSMVRGQFNDAEIVELTLVNCYFNYLTRLANAANLQVEDWANAPAAPFVYTGVSVPRARVALATDAELDAAVKLKTPPATTPSPSASLGTFIANSRRAMVRVPDIANAWWDYWASVREYNDVTRPEKLQVSFAVSNANGCRYCVLHQVLGLKRAGVDVAKLVAMKKDDSTLTPREKAAVNFARKLTITPGQMTGEDTGKLHKLFGTQGTTEVILQTCAFNFMNRFTDPLGLPSEDEAIEAYHEVYGPGAYQAYRAEKAR